ncbi:hypothetical protein [Pararhodobacter sp. SW119]|uniref:hypothetical protein n=1 Tax=Pararhodobacter sp. SW119 TaxID=2780075 RepID=UPI001ADFD4D7|nr:hypothetical protein [Pararhodobacter sp. SW119]
MPDFASLDFSDLPKQWIVAPSPLPDPVAGKRDRFAGYDLAMADAVPVQILRDARGAEVGRLIGWPIHGETLHRADGTLRLAEGEGPEDLFDTLGGRFVLLWQAEDGRVLLREDSAGSLPAIFAPAAGIVAATVTLMDQLHPLPVATEVEAIFDFPTRRGFLPFGLTPRQGAHRLMPNHALDLSTMSTRRVWPDAAFAARPPLTDTRIAAGVAETAAILRRHMTAILKQGETVLYLSGGQDSRTVLAAARGMTENLRAETLGDAGLLDAHVAAQVARAAGIPHARVSVLPVSGTEIETWLTRSGRMMFDPVTLLSATAVKIHTGNHPISGTGAEIMRASNWGADDLEAPEIDVDRLLARVRMPDLPVTRRAAQAWIDSLPPMDAALAIDLAKIEQIHGCWSGAEAYGHPLPFPTLNPFSGQQLNEIALAMPGKYRLSNAMFGELMRSLWPELLEVPINRATGLSRLRFWRAEITRMIPAGLRRKLKPLR